MHAAAGVETAIVIALIMVMLGVLAARKIRLQYTIALVILGLVVGMIPWVPRVQLTPHLILFVFLPPLIFEASFNLGLPSLQRNAAIIALLAVPGVLITALVIGGLIHWSLGEAIGPALLFGALIAATDPVSVLAIFRDLGAPRRLSAVVEAESLLNDGTAIVLFSIVLAALTSGGVSVGEGVLRFIWVSLGGAALGVVIGFIAVTLLRHVDEQTIEVTATVVVAYGTYLLADSIGISGVIAVVAAGVIFGNLRALAVSPITRITLEWFWEFIAFLGNALIFLLIGMRVVGLDLVRKAPAAALVILIVLASRALVVALANASLLPWGKELTWRHTPLLWWGGVRGAVALALTLSLPLDLAARSWIQPIAFDVVIFSLIVQGLTVGPLTRWLDIAESPSPEVEYRRHRARLRAYQQALREVWRNEPSGKLPAQIVDRLRGDYERMIRREHEAITALDVRHGLAREESEEALQAQRHALETERMTLLQLWERGRLSDDAMHSMIAQIDDSLVQLDTRDEAVERAIEDGSSDDDDEPAAQSEPSSSHAADPNRYNSSS